MRRGATMGVAAAMLLVVSLPAGAQQIFPEVRTTIDQLQVAWDDAANARPALVTWRTTGEVDGGPIEMVPELTLGPTAFVDRSDLGPDVPSDYPISLEVSWHPPYCEGSAEAARWMHGSQFLERGRSWVGLEGSEAGLTGYSPSGAPDGSRLQWAEIAVGGLNRFPPQEPYPGGHIETRLLGTNEHLLEWVDPAEACFIGGVRRVSQEVSVSTVAIEAVGGDVTFEGGEDLPEIAIPLAGDLEQDVAGYAIFYQGLPGVVSGVPGIGVDADVVVASDPDGRNPRLRIFPFAGSSGTWRESRRTPVGTDWQLRFTVVSYTETVDLGSEEMGEARLFPGGHALVVTRDAAGDRVQRFRADGHAELRIGQDGARLLALGDEASTPFAQLNGCDVESSPIPVDPPPPPPDPGGGISVRTPGLGDAVLPHAVPPAWQGFTFGEDASGLVSLHDVVIAGHAFGELALPYVRVDGALHPVTPEAVVEGPIVFQRQFSIGDASGGISWDTLMLGMVVDVGGVELPLYWSFHAKVAGKEAACVRVEPILSDVQSPGSDVELIWFVGVNLGGRPESYAKAFRIGQGYQIVEEEKTFLDVLGVVDSPRSLGLLDKGDVGRRFMVQTWGGSGPVTLLRHHGTKVADPRAAADGENIDGTDLAYYLVDQREGRLWSETPFLIFRCGPCGPL